MGGAINCMLLQRRAVLKFILFYVHSAIQHGHSAAQTACRTR